MHTASPLVCAPALACMLAVAGGSVRAQDIEPRTYSNAPIGVNFLIAGYARTAGGLATDPALPVTDPELETTTAVPAYARVIDVFGRSAKVDAIVPYTWLSGEAKLDGAPIEREVDGLGDARVRLSVNLYGAPALSLREFAGWRQDLIVGASLQVSAPTGRYDETRLVNIGTNRWSFKPEIGVSKALGQWTLEGAVAAVLFTDNDDFFGGQRREQEALCTAQAHAIYSFRSGIWVSFDVSWYAGGETTVNGLPKRDRQENWRVGGVVALPLDARNSLKFSVSNGVSTRTGNSYDLIAAAWQYRWGAGL